MKQLIFNPYKNIDFETIGKYKANLHTHTTESDGGLYGADVIEIYKNANYKILALTDHDSFRPERSPRELGGQLFVNVWDWTLFEGEESYQAPLSSLDFVKDEIDGLVSNGMLSIQGNEISNVHHIGAYDMDYSGETPQTVENGLTNVRDRKGIAMFFHPGRYTRGVMEYVDWYKEFYPICRGMEVYNQGNKYPNDRDLWDDVLKELMPQMPIFGWSNDDMHVTSQLFKNYNTLLMKELNISEFRTALSNGRGFFSYEPAGSGNALAPTINNLTVNEAEGTITIDADNYNEINWICEKEIIGTGETFNYSKSRELTSYVRARLIGDNGFTYTQPFGFVDVGQGGQSGGLFPALRGG